MGILLPIEHMLRRLVAERWPAGGFTVLEFGDQIITHSDPHELAEKLYRRLGAKRYCSVDGNGRGTVTFDLNRPSKELKRIVPKFARLGADLVTDFGTGEHVFDQAQFFRTMHDMTKAGGFMAFDRPSQGYPGHCFWRTDESTYRDVAAANGYQVIELELHDGRPLAGGGKGELVRGILRKLTDLPFKLPQQGRYKKLLRPITHE